MQLQADRTGLDLLDQRIGQAGIALAQKAQVHRQALGRFEHAGQMPGTRRAGGGIGAGGRSGAAPDHRGHPRHQGLIHLLRADEMDMGVDTSGGDDHAFAGNHLGTRTDDDVHTGLHIGVASLADGRDAPALETDIGLDDAPVVDDQCIGDDRVHRVARTQL